jgi:hypothetical protein
MRRVTITVPDELEQALVEYQHAQDVPPTITAIVQTALRQYLAGRWHIPATGPFEITPDEHGSGRSDISVNHDRYLAGVSEREAVSRR